jgi:hypothetical protein
MRFSQFMRYRPGWRAMTSAAAVSGIAVGSWCLWTSPHVMDRWVHSQIVSLPDEELAPWMSGLLARDGVEGISLVVDDLTSTRPTVRRAANQALRDEIDRWSTTSTKSAPLRAMAMAEAIRQLPDATRQSAGAELAARIKLWADSANCPAATRGRIALALKDVAPSPVVREVATVRVPDSASSVVVQSNQSPATQSPTSATTQFPPSAETVAKPPQTVSKQPGVSAPRLIVPQNERAVLDAEHDADWDLSPRPDELPAEQAAPNVNAPLAPLPPADPESAEDRKTPTRELIAALHGDRREETTAELRARGFNDEAIELAAHLSARDRKERLQWTSSLPRISNIDAKAWLTWMTEDPDAEVRRTAVTLLGTSIDEATLTLFRKLAARDPDQLVRRLAADLVRRQ